MDEPALERNETTARLLDVERELRTLRSAVEYQNHLVSQLTSSVGAIHAHVAPADAGNRVGTGKRGSSATQVWTDSYIALSRLLRRADVEQLFDKPYYISRNPDLVEVPADPVYHFLRCSSPVSPHWLFDRDYYLQKYPDVVASKVEPLTHFVRSGWLEGRNPHPLFCTAYYLDQVPDLKGGKLNPVTHYLETGWKEGLKPHPLFDGDFYLTKYPDVAAAAMNPLTHYVLFGGKEARQPHPWFDAAYYLQRSPDIAAAKVEPVQHYVEYGHAEGRDPHPQFDTAFYGDQIGPALGPMSPLEHYVRYGIHEKRPTLQIECSPLYLPVDPYEPPPLRGKTIDIIIPVYRGLDETRACIESVLKSSNREPFHVVVIDDLSPEPKLSAWLEDAAKGGDFELLVNQTNLGFVNTVNRGMSLHPDRDVLLLNSDTTVANDWLDRLVRQAYAPGQVTGQVGTVTPFSNNATICSYPRFCEDNELPASISAGELDRLAAVTNQGRSVDVPTGVGFCMYIRRDCLRETGLFDAELFGKGYGEENDFCLRAATKGWRSVLAADVFVFHAGSVSFAKGAFLLRERGVKALVNRHPKYPTLVSRHVLRDAAQPYRFALTAARLKASSNPAVLIVTHDMAGGIRQHIEELVESLKGQVNFLELRPEDGNYVNLTSPDPADGIALRFDITRHYDLLLAVLRSCSFSRMHVHHVLRHSISIEKLRHDLGVSMDFTIHDYMAICPRFVLAKPDGRYCGEPDESGCNECIRTTLPHLNLDIGSWRANYAWLLNSADRVITPSADSASRMSRRFPAAKIHAAVHPLQIAPAELPRVQHAKIKPDGVLRIATIGVMTWHKGLAVLERCAKLAKLERLPLEFILVGYCEAQVQSAGPFTFRETGAYTLEALPSILQENEPHLMWLPQRWPETFSYTLSACLEHGLPIFATQLGALPERLMNRPWTWVYDWDRKPEDLIEIFLKIRDAMIAGIAPHPPAQRAQADPAFYVSDYRKGALQRADVTRPSVDLREPAHHSVIALLSSYDSGQMQSCGYIRAYLPLMHDRLENLIRLTVTTPESALKMAADIVLVQRTTVPSMKLAEQLIEHCERFGMRLVYETDDDLFNIDPNHPESEFYKSLAAPAELIARHASLVLVSSPVLKSRLAHLNPDVRVIPNALDETLWFTGKKPNRIPSKPVRILYMGSMTHSKDLDILEEPVRMLKAELPGAFELDLIGILPHSRTRDWFNTIEVPAIHGASYPLFTEWIRKENRWDFAVAPLVNDDFNRCKSYIKYLDYAALGLPCIFSAIDVFEEVVKEGVTGFCVKDADGWYDAMRLLLTNPKLRRQMGDAAYYDVETNHTLAAQVEQRRQLWDQIGNLPAVRSSNTIVSFSEETTAANSNGL